MAEEPRGFNPDWKDPLEPGDDPIPVGSLEPTPAWGVPIESLPPPIKGSTGVDVSWDGGSYVITMDTSEIYATPKDGSVTWPTLAEDVEAEILDHSWNSLTDVPPTFPASPHTHTVSQITDFPTTWAWGALTGVPATFPPSTHTHGTTGIDDNAITNAKLRDSAAYSVIGRTGNSAGDPQDILAAANDTLLRRVSNVVGFGALTAGMFPANIVTNAMMAQMATATFKARATAGTGNAEDLTVAQAKTLLAIAIADVSGLQAALDLKLADAPSDGDTYGRKNGAWVKAAGAAQIQDTAPATGDVGTFWWSSLTGQLAIRYNDGNTTQWVGLNGSITSAVVIADNAPAVTYPGMLWWESDTGELMIRYNDGDSEQWVSAFGGARDARWDTPWDATTSAVTASSGTITAATCSINYKKVGTVAHVEVSVSITNNGTGAGRVQITLPAALVPLRNAVMAGRENGLTGKNVHGIAGAAATLMAFYADSNSYPGGTGALLVLNGTWEVAP